MNLTKIEICQKYRSGDTLAQIAQGAKAGTKTIRKILVDGGVSIKTGSEIRRKYPLNEKYFDKIDSEEKAYFLGFLYADGCVCRTSKNCYVLSVALHIQDIEILNKLNDVLTNSTKPFTYYESRNMVGASFNSKILFDSLVKAGCFPRKSLLLKFPTAQQVPQTLLKHFIRGYMDGDGTVTSANGKRPHMTLTTSSDFAKSFSEEMKNYGMEARTFDSGKNCVYCRIAQRTSFIKFFDYIYSDSKISLRRKKDKYQKLIEANPINKYCR